MICIELDQKILEINLDWQRKEVLSIFQQVLSGELEDPRIIYAKLTAYELDYDEAIGMRSWRNRFHEWSHGDFGAWHQINLSLTGHWLIEFQATENPEIIFHSPYDRRKGLNFDFDWDKLSCKDSDQANFGRAATEEEQEQYPIEELVRIFGMSALDFPYGLSEYEPPVRPQEDWHDREDEESDDWLYA